MEIRNAKIFVAGHRGLVGSSVTRHLKSLGNNEVLTKLRSELDLRNAVATEEFFKTNRPDIVILAAARVGGIGANTRYPVEFLLENLQIQANVISSAANFGVKKLVFLGSSCIYPRDSKQPMTEDQLLTSAFEPTNEPYALAKVTGIKLCQAYKREYQKNFISLMPTNMYGPNDYYDLYNSHVIPAMLLKVMIAKIENRSSVTLWGSGRAYREFLHADDLARAIVSCIENYDDEAPINVGSGREIQIVELAELICRACNYKGKIEWDSAMPDGMHRKLLENSKITSLGWKPKIDLEEGLKTVLVDAEAAARLALGRGQKGEAVA